MLSRWIALDIETAPREDAEAFIPPVQAASNLVDLAKKAADIEKREAKQREQCSLDWNTSRIVMIGYQTESMSRPQVLRCRTMRGEARHLHTLWAHVCDEALEDYSTWSAGRATLGFNVLRFDLPTLLQRSRYLRVPAPHVDLRRYNNLGVRDLFSILTFDDAPTTSVMKRSLDMFCRQFRIRIPDVMDGAEVSARIAAGDWNAVANHCRADVRKIVALARRLNLIAPATKKVSLTDGADPDESTCIPSEETRDAADAETETVEEDA